MPTTTQPPSGPQTPPAVSKRPRARLTIDQLLPLARVGSNHSWLRWWAHWNHPQNPVQMAISLMDENGKTTDCHALEVKGFEKLVTNLGLIVYVCDRVDESGKPFVSRLG